MEKETTSRIDMPLYTIYEEFIQEAVESNLGRRLTETELKRLPSVFVINEMFFHHIYQAVIESAKEAMDQKGWEMYDRQHSNMSLEEIIG